MKTTRIATYSLAGFALFLTTAQIGAGAQVINPPPSLINFQGRLARPDGTPVADGTNYAVTLSLWDAVSGGSMRWSQTFTNITVRNGVFAVALNLNSGFTSGNTLDTTLNNNTYLQVQVGTNAALSPRQQLVSTAYALKAATVPDGSISVSKLTTALKNSILGGAAGGDLTGAYPNPLLKTDSSLLNKVSGTLLSVASASTVLDQGQTTVTNTVTSSAWQSFEPGSTGTLVEIDVNAGTTGAAVSATLTLYDGIGTGGAILQTIPITIQPSQGLQSFPITVSVTQGHDYTWAIGSNNNLSFGYAGGKPYANGVTDLGATFSYAFQTRMRATSTPSSQINSTAYFAFAATPGVILAKQYNPFISGSNIGVGRFGLFQPDATTLFMGIPGTDISGPSLRLGTWSATGTRTDLLTMLNSGNVGIGTTTPLSALHITPTSGITIGQNPTSGGYTALNISLSAVSGGNAQIQSIKSGGSAYGDLILNPTAGNVGIGTTTPTALLDVNGTLRLRSLPTQSGNVLTVDSSGNIGANNIASTLGAAGGDLTGTYPNPTIAANKITSAKLASDSTSLNKVSGGAMTSTGTNIGIGIANPTTPLNVSTTGNFTGLFQSTSNVGSWVRIQNDNAGRAYDLITSAASNTEGAGKLLFHDATNGTRMTLDGANGRLGIMTASPTSTLDVAGDGHVSGRLVADGYIQANGPMYAFGSENDILSNYGYLATSGAGKTSGSGGSQPYALYATARIAATEFNAYSDVRLKRPIGRSDSAHDLDTLLGIEVTDYTLRDTIAQGDRVHKKVLAQQVETVYPQAVSRSTGWIPDIYHYAKVNNGWVQLATNLKAGERVKLITAKGRTEIVTVLDATPQSFKLDLPNTTETFVYGREVSDLRTVDYEAIAMLNVSATQAMYRQLDEMKVKNAESETNLAALKAKNAAMEARLAAIEAALKQIKPTSPPAADKPVGK